MEKCLQMVRGPHDFSSFCSGAEYIVNPVRHMIRAECIPAQGGVITFAFEANGFLRYMVRTIVGAMVKVGLGEMSVDRFAHMMESTHRQHPGVKAPPGGLYLADVKY
jgi:tRNA pseudouridine38-40 synthase